MSDAPQSSIEALLAETAWLRRLAAGLAQDPADADDLTQETLLAALHREPAAGASLRPWLKTVLRRLWSDRLRARRRTPIVRQSTPEPSVSDTVARFSLHTQVASSVAALPEPYRSAILLRFYEDLPPREVARRLDVPVETARTRIRRGLALIRERLDRESGSRAAWLLPLLQFPLSGMTAGATVGGKGVAICVAIAVLALPAWWVVSHAQPRERDVDEPPRSLGTATGDPHAVEEPTVATHASSARRTMSDPGARTAISVDPIWERYPRSSAALPYQLLSGALDQPEHLFRHRQLNPDDRYILPDWRLTLDPLLERYRMPLKEVADLLARTASREFHALVVGGRARSHGRDEIEARASPAQRAAMREARAVHNAYREARGLAPEPDVFSFAPDQAPFAHAPFMLESNGKDRVFLADLHELPESAVIHAARIPIYLDATTALLSWFVAAGALDTPEAAVLYASFRDHLRQPQYQ